MQAQDIEQYLSQLGQELGHLGVHQPFRVLMIGNDTHSRLVTKDECTSWVFEMPDEREVAGSRQ
jgi:hypothetical protein